MILKILLLFLQISHGATTAAQNFSEIKGLDLVTGRQNEIQQRPSVKVFVFLSSNCPCSRAHELRLNSLHEQYSKKGVEFYGINSNADEPLEQAQKYFSQSGLKFPVIKDNNAVIANRFGALKTPHVFVTNTAGAVVFSGGVDDSRTADKEARVYLKEALDSVLQGKNPDPAEVRALGCVIERS